MKRRNQRKYQTRAYQSSKNEINPRIIAQRNINYLSEQYEKYMQENYMKKIEQYNRRKEIEMQQKKNEEDFMKFLEDKEQHQKQLRKNIEDKMREDVKF